MLAVRGFEGFTALTGCEWGWTVSSVSGGTATLTITKKQLQYLYFSYLQLGYYGPDTSSSASEGSGFIGIIIGLIVAIILISAAVFLFLKCYWWKRHTFKAPQRD